MAQAENWPQWRGPRGDGTSLELNVPVEWGVSKNILWKTELPGEGHSSAVLWKEALFITSSLKDSGQRLLLRLDARSGEVVWQQVALTAEVESMHRENSPASSTAVTDGTSIYTSFQSGRRVDLQCYDFTGKQVWSTQPLRFQGMHGYSYTPLLYQDLVIVDFSQNDEAAVLGLNKKTGQIRWRFDRDQKDISHVTPLLISDKGRTQVITCGADQVRSLDPETGKTLWWCAGPTDVAVAGLAYGDGTVFATGGYPEKTRLAVRADGNGEVTATHLRWKTFREVSYVPSPVFHQGHLYTVVDDGLLYCFDAQTGRTVWEHRLGGRFRSSLLLAAGNIYATNDKGLTTVFRATSEGFRPLATNDLKEFVYATPAISNGRIYLRTGKSLYCIGSAQTASR